MPKRSRRRVQIEEDESDDAFEGNSYESQHNDDEYIEGEVEDEGEGEYNENIESGAGSEVGEDDSTSKFPEAVSQAIRIVLGRDVRDQFIRREHFSQVINTKRYPLDAVIKETNIVLEDVYGLRLVEVPMIRNEKKSNRALSSKTSAKARQPYAVINCLKLESQQVLGELWQSVEDFKVPNDRDSSSEKFFIPKKEKTNTPASNIELIKVGIMLYIVSFIILAENHLSESDLIKILKKRGLSESLNVKNSNLNLNIVELINDLTKREYLNKDVKKGATESDNIVDYSLGRRSLIEFTPQCVFEYFKVLYGPKFDDTIAERIFITVHRAYGVELSRDPDLSAVGTEVSTPSNDVEE
ncbi:MAGE family-domain-containing protein [Scheffersomyces coipomensis]|uniref:MAGE family-domain-containing protein n=1 Tax=Scheffersomyces coipomensis TaxID=1788519 RepID=UPI00315CB820